MAEEKMGLRSLAESVRLAISGGDMKEVEEACSRVATALSSTLLDISAVTDKDVVDAYMAMLQRGLGLLADALAARGQGADTAQLLALVMCGGAVAAPGCVVVEALAPLPVGGRVADAGSVLCMEPRRAIMLELAGLARIVRKSVLSGFQGS